MSDKLLYQKSKQTIDKPMGNVNTKFHWAGSRRVFCKKASYSLDIEVKLTRNGNTNVYVLCLLCYMFLKMNTSHDFYI